MASSALYSSLKHEDSIRLFRRHSGAKDEQITGYLVEVRLSDNPEYECISYTWGTEQVTKAIIINGTELPIRQNLHDCLERLRNTDVPRPLWIDAISISQNDLTEKASQVEMIGKIFTLAKKVLVWLGYRDLSYSNSPTILGMLEGTKWADDISPEHCRMMVFNEYWTRTWTVQEIVLAKEIEVWYCCSHLKWEEFIKLVLFLEENNPKEPILSRCFSVLGYRKHRDERLEPQYQGGHLIWHLVDQFLINQCYDGHDKIYALLEMEMFKSTQKLIRVDYTTSLAEMLWEVIVKRPAGSYEGHVAGKLASHLNLNCTALESLNRRLLSGNNGLDLGSEWGKAVEAGLNQALEQVSGTQSILHDEILYNAKRSFKVSPNVTTN